MPGLPVDPSRHFATPFVSAPVRAGEGSARLSGISTGIFPGIFPGATALTVSAQGDEDGHDEEEWDKKRSREERIKRAGDPLAAHETLLENAAANTAPARDDVFRFKWHGLFWASPVSESYMCRLRIPGGMVRAFQLRELSAISRDLTTGHIQITNRGNFQLRQIEPRDAPEVLRRIQGCGLHARGSGADSVRNLTMSPLAGLDPGELVDVRPLVHELQREISGTRDFYDLPRKFNIAFDGGGAAAFAQDANDIGASAVEVAANNLGLAPGVWFRLALGGVGSQQAFAKDAGVLVRPPELARTCAAILRVFIREGDRANRQQARLKHVVDRMGMAALVAEAEKLLPFSLVRLPVDDPCQLPGHAARREHAHVGVHPQKQPGLLAVGVAVPVGQVTEAQLEAVADISERFGSGEVRLTVWQNLLIPDVREEDVPSVVVALRKAGLDAEQSNVKSGVTACTGNRHCKHAAADTKGHALEAMAHLEGGAKEGRFALDHPVNIHFTGCANSCVQHYTGDVGLMAVKVKSGDQWVEGYHITVGGGFGGRQRVGRQVFTSVPATQVAEKIERMLKVFQSKRLPEENFYLFCARYSVTELQAQFA